MCKALKKPIPADWIGWDGESVAFGEFLKAPPTVCMQFYHADGTNEITDAVGGLIQTLNYLNAGKTLIGFNVKIEVYMCLMAAEEAGFSRKLVYMMLHRALDRGQIRDGMMAYRLTQLATKGNTGPLISLTDVAKKTGVIDETEYERRKAEKEGDVWRLKYDLLKDRPISEWPEKAVGYAMDDARDSLHIYCKLTENPRFAKAKDQAGGWVRHCYVDKKRNVRGERVHLLKDFGLKAMEVWGFKIDEEHHAKKTEEIQNKFDFVNNKLISTGLLYRNPKTKSGWSKNMREIKNLIYDAYDGDPPITDSGHKFLYNNKDKTKADAIELGYISTSKDTIQAAPNLPPNHTLRYLLSYNKLSKLDGYLSAIANKRRVYPGYDPLKNTGRTGSFNPSSQTWPKKGQIRNCATARDGHLFIIPDLSSQEIRSFVQILTYFGLKPRLLKKFQEDPNFDAHSDFAVTMAWEMHGIRTSYAELRNIIKNRPDHKYFALFHELRNVFAKIANFGFQGGMVPRTALEYARMLGYEVTLEDMERVYKAWLKYDPAYRKYFQIIKRQSGWDSFWSSKKYKRISCGTIAGPKGGIVRAKAPYTACSNHYFQNLAARAAGYTTGMLARATVGGVGYEGLRDSHMWEHVHDEWGMESPIYKVFLACDDFVRCIEESMQLFHPDVPCVVEAGICKVWDKNAESKRNEDGTWTIYQTSYEEYKAWSKDDGERWGWDSWNRSRP